MKIQIIIDGRMVQVDDGTTVLKAARKAGIVIPTLCHHEALQPYGSCRLCVVEVIQNRRRRTVTSCTYPAAAGMEVLTETERVKELRRNAVELLLSRCPDVPLVQKMARQMGIGESRLRNREGKECILCGLCVRFCEEVVGVNAIGLSNRGVECEVSTPFGAPSDTCIGCGSCTYICPAGCIEMVPDEESPDKRRMKMGNLKPEPCPHRYRCETCDTDRLFLDDARRVITRFREEFRRSPDGASGGGGGRAEDE